MSRYDDMFPPSLTDEEKEALAWKIDKDYRDSDMGAIAFKDEFVAFAIHFYTRNLQSLEDVVTQYRAYSKAKHRRNLAAAFRTDMKTRLRERELGHN